MDNQVASSTAVAVKFATAGLMPKDETQALEFLKKYPEFDGRGVVVAVLDTGVDPAADGLKITTEGKPKIIDIIDCSGSGDVSTSLVRTATEGVLEGASGRRLTVSSGWKNPTGRFHLGVLRGFDIFPRDLVERMKRERKTDLEAAHHKQLAALYQQLERTDAAQKREKKELELRIEQLNEALKVEDVGPVMDCVVFHDGENWRAVLDVDESGDLSQREPMADYHVERQFGFFSTADLLSYSVNIYDAGRVLSVVTTAGSHGTHVAGIIGAHYPNQPELNGVAPGCQIVSLKIGDSRQGSMETGTAVVRALSAVARLGCDALNVSYGEPASMCSGRVNEIAHMLVNKHNAVLVGSAGNNGPALSTVGAPGGTFSHMLGIGAYVSPPMMSAQYSMRQELPEGHYTWSSRGPALDGALGVAVCAPGGAISPVPTYTLSKSQQMNGTSMSSPNACGNIALILSGLKQLKIAPSHHFIRLALQNTARAVPEADVFVNGHGLLQCVNAFEWCRAHAAHATVRLTTDLPRRANARGLYLRDAEESSCVQEVEVRVRCHLPEHATSQDKVALEMRLALSCAASWVQVPQQVLLLNGERVFVIRVDPTQLAADQAHFAEVVGVDVAHPSAGPVLRLPVTVIRPIRVETASVSRTLLLQPGRVSRLFITPPEGAVSAELTVRGSSIDTARRVVVHILQLPPQTSLKFAETEKYLALTGSDDEEVVSFKVQPGYTLEVCLAQFWSSLGASTVEYSLDFRGLCSPNTASYHLVGPSDALRVDVRSMCRTEELSPTVTLKKVHSAVRPTAAGPITASGAARDTLPNGKQVHELILQYSYTLREEKEVTFRLPALSTLLYESVHEAQFWMVFNANKRLVASGDAWPKPVKLPKGEYTVRVQLRHDRVELLEKLRDVALIVERTLSKEITLALYTDLNAFVTDGAKFAPRKLKVGDKAVFYVGSVKDEPREAQAGDVLSGFLSLVKEEAKAKKLDGIPFTYVISSATKASPIASVTAAAADPDEAKLPPVERLDRVLLRAKIDFLGRLLASKSLEDFRALAVPLREQQPRHLPLLRLFLRAADDSKPEEVVAAADAIVASLDRPKLAAFLGLKHDPEDPDTARLQREADAQKQALIDALSRKAAALADSNKDEMVSAWKELKHWVEADEAQNRFSLTYIKYLRATGQPAAALKHVNKCLKDLTGDPLERKLVDIRLELLVELGASHLLPLYRRLKLVDFPSSFTLFG